MSKKLDSDVMSMEKINIAVQKSILLELIGIFEKRVWLKGLREKVLGSDEKNLKFSPSDIFTELHIYKKDEKVFLTFVSCDDEEDLHRLELVCSANNIPSGMGFRKIDASLEKAEEMLVDVIEAWQNPSARKLEKVRVFRIAEVAQFGN